MEVCIGSRLRPTFAFRLGAEQTGDFRWLVLLVGDDIVRIGCNIEALCMHKLGTWRLEYE